MRYFIVTLLQKTINFRSLPLFDKPREGLKVSIFQHQHVSSPVVRGVLAALYNALPVIHAPAKQHAQESALMAKPARQLI